MKKILLRIMTLTVCATLFFSMPVMAQTGGTDRTETEVDNETDADDDGDDEWGLLGLAGLLGLLGLKRRDRDDRDGRTNVNR